MKNDCITYKGKRYCAVVIVAYDCHLGERGTILSRHTSHKMAARQARSYGGAWTRIADDMGQKRGDVYDPHYLLRA